jgi:hypothetical protein
MYCISFFKAYQILKANINIFFYLHISDNVWCYHNVFINNICLLDFSKAFDRIDNVLLRKLQQMAVHPVLINWIADFLYNRLQREKIGQDYSAWKYIQTGVPQGTKLGPLLS